MINIRNFCIIAHIDHGKTTLANSILKITNTIQNSYNDLFLDDMDIERERGITIKSRTIQMVYNYNNKQYILNLIDTPGHVDFAYEVSRSIAACEGALLVIDATQGIQSQTIANMQIALKNKLKIIPVLNKIDISHINIYNNIIDEIIHLLNCKYDDILFVSAKKGTGIIKLLESIILNIPYPTGSIKEPLQALIFDSIYNPFRGIEVYFKIKNGTIYQGQKLKFLATGKIYHAEEIGIFKLKKLPQKNLYVGNVGYVILGIKNVFEIKIGDTITSYDNQTKIAIEGFQKVKPMIFAGIYPIETKFYENLKIALKKLQLNDASLIFTHESSSALGFGFRCGFLGMLHMEIIQERLEREYGIFVIITVPNVSYHVFLKKNLYQPIIINNPSDFMTISSSIDRIEEPYIKVTIITISDYLGKIISLCIEKRGLIKNQFYLNDKRVELIFELPLSEIIFDFYDRLKTISKGYASFDYSPLEYRSSDLIKLNILINHKSIDPLSILVHRSNAFNIGKKICKKLQELIPRQQFQIPIQASIFNKVIARETIQPLRKDVTAKCYGGDISRKRKLLEKQKEGKKRMRQIGNVEIPQSAFISVLKIH